MILLYVLCFHSLIGLSHNWLQTPTGRGGSKASPVIPAPAEDISGGQRFRHLEVGSGQSFQIEWATGHPSNMYYFVVLKAEDEPMIVNHTYDLLEQYLDEAPANAVKWTEEEYQRIHISCSYYYNGTEPDSSGTYVFQPECAGKFSANPGTYAYVNEGQEIDYAKLLTPEDTRWYNRSKFRSGWDDVALFAYHDEYLNDVADDKRVEYTNSGMPWIEAVHRFNIAWPRGRPFEYDGARFTISANQGSGRYIIHMVWGGYRDVVQVDVYPSDTVDPYGVKQGDHWKKREHCMYTNYMPTAQMVPDEEYWNRIYHVSANLEYGVEQCMQYCMGRMTCKGLNLIPIQPKGNTDLTYPYYFPWNVPLAQADGYTGDPMFINQPEMPDWVDPTKDFFCVPLRVQDPQDPYYNPTVEFEYYISEDPEDPIFYSTCLTKEPELVFPAENGDCPICEAEYEELRQQARGGGDDGGARFRYGEYCISCANNELMGFDSLAVNWETTQGDCRQC